MCGLKRREREDLDCHEEEGERRREKEREGERRREKEERALLNLLCVCVCVKEADGRNPVCVCLTPLWLQQQQHDKRRETFRGERKKLNPLLLGIVGKKDGEGRKNATKTMVTLCKNARLLQCSGVRFPTFGYSQINLSLETPPTPKVGKYSKTTEGGAFLLGHPVHVRERNSCLNKLLTIVAMLSFYDMTLVCSSYPNKFSAPETARIYSLA